MPLVQLLMVFVSGPSLGDAALPSRTMRSLAASILPGPYLVPPLLQLLFYSLVSLQQMIKSKPRKVADW